MVSFLAEAQPPRPEGAAPLSAAAQLEKASAAAAAAADPKSGDAAGLAAGAAFDGAKAEYDPVSESAAAGMPGYLVAAEAGEVAWLAEVVSSLGESKTGRAVLKQVQALATERGRPFILDVGALSGAHGTFDFDQDMISLDNGVRSKPLPAAASVLAHEMQHALQSSYGLPIKAIEMEIEAFVVQFRVSDELGYRWPRNTFIGEAQKHIIKDEEKFFKHLREGYRKDLWLVGENLADFEAELRRLQKVQDDKVAKLEKLLARKRRALETLTRTNQRPEAVEAYRVEHILGNEEKLRKARAEQRWRDHDVTVIGSQSGRRRYRAFADRVRKKSRSYHASKN